MTPEQASTYHDELKRLLLKDELGERRLKKVLDSLVAAAEMRDENDRAIWNLLSEASNSGDEEMSDMILMGLDHDALFRAFKRAGQYGAGLEKVMVKLRLRRQPETFLPLSSFRGGD